MELDTNLWKQPFYKKKHFMAGENEISERKTDNQKSWADS